MDIDLLEKDLIAAQVDSIVIERMREIVSTLDDAYGSNRSAKDMGGYIFFFGDEETYENSFSHLLTFYNLAMENYEYSEIINEMNDSETKWWEELYMLSSDDAIVFVHPKGA